MKVVFRISLLLLTCIVLQSTHVIAETLKGRVVKVSDGDTITVLDTTNHQHKIRLMGIDAPEKKQPFGERSKQALSSIVYDRQVVVEYSKLDRYGRKVGKILVGGIDANLRQVEAGMAWHYKKYQAEQSPEDRDLYVAAENQARRESKGLWSDREPVPPWDWRKLKKKRV
jgi:endonuclease YncB( thermonuclease family)